MNRTTGPSLAAGTVQGRKLVFLGGGDGACYAFEALAGVPEDPVTLKTAWWVDCNPPEYRSFGGLDLMVHYTLGDRRRKDTLNKLNDGSFVGMSEIIATPVFYEGRVYVAIGRDPEHGRGRGALVAWTPTRRATAPRPASSGPTRDSTARSRRCPLPMACCTSRTWPGGYTASTPRPAMHWVYDSKSRVIASTLVADGKIYLPTKNIWTSWLPGRR